MQQRPTGVTILAVLAFIGGVLGICGGLGGIAAAGLVGTTAIAASAGVAMLPVGELLGLSVVLLVISVLDIVLGVGFLQLKPWAWSLGVGLQAFSILWAIVEIALKASNIGSEALGIILSAVVIYYLYRPNVKQAFGRA